MNDSEEESEVYKRERKRTKLKFYIKKPSFMTRTG